MAAGRASERLSLRLIVHKALATAPGLLALTVFGIVGPVIVIERRGAVDAFIRSARLSLPHIITTSSARSARPASARPRLSSAEPA